MARGSKFKGVRYEPYIRGRKAPKPWQCVIGVNYKAISLGYFDTERKAAIAYDKYVLKNNLKRTLNILKKV